MSYTEISQKSFESVLTEENDKNKFPFTFKGRHHTKESKRKISESNKGKHSKFGKNNPFYGKHHTEETRKKISEALNNGKCPWVGKHHTEETKKKMSINNGRCWKGKKIPKEIREKMSKSHIGRVAWNKGMTGIFSEETRKIWSKQRKGNKHASGHRYTEEERKRMSESRKGKNTWNIGRFGEKSNSWRGGLSFLPYCSKFNNQLKEAVRNRDDRTCQLCNAKENGKKPAVHHVHYDKENCYPDLITLCHKCNCKVNGNREYYESLFMNKLNERKLLFWTQRNGD